jgi:hypothetical protein
MTPNVPSTMDRDYAIRCLADILLLVVDDARVPLTQDAKLLLVDIGTAEFTP